MRERLQSWLETVFAGALPGWLVPDQAALVALGFLFAAVAAVWLAHRDGLPLREVSLGLLACFVGAIFGSRLFANLMRVEAWLANPWALVDLRGPGSASLGALIGGCVAFWIYARRARLDPWRAADAMAPAAGVGLAFARLGCFVHGCDFGRVTALPWGVRYPNGSVPFSAQHEHGFVGPYQDLSLPVLPFQLVLAGSALLIFVVFAACPGLGRTGRAGDRALLAGAAYFVLRFGVEFLRSPWTSPMLGLLNLVQWLCLGSLVVLWALRRARDRGLSAAGEGA